MSITREFIQSMYWEELQRTQRLLSEDLWAHAPNVVVNIKRMSALGSAGPVNGVTISEAYIGTDLYDELRDTIRHELAHMAAGVSAAHGPAWRRIARHFGATPRARSKSCQAIKKASASMCKYTLVVHLESGEKHIVGGRNRRDRKYAEYSTGSGHRYRLDGVIIEKFEYVQN